MALCETSRQRLSARHVLKCKIIEVLPTLCIPQRICANMRLTSRWQAGMRQLAERRKVQLNRSSARTFCFN